MNRDAAARALARALSKSLADDSAARDAAVADAGALRALWRDCPEWRAFCAAGRRDAVLPSVPRATPSAPGGFGGLSAPVRLLIGQMAEWNLLPLLDRVCGFFLEDAARAAGRRRARAVFAVEPTEADLEILREKLARKFSGAPVDLETSVDPSLLAGFRVMIGDRLTDASLAGRIRRMTSRKGL